MFVAEPECKTMGDNNNEDNPLRQSPQLAHSSPSVQHSNSIPLQIIETPADSPHSPGYNGLHIPVPTALNGFLNKNKLSNVRSASGHKSASSDASSSYDPHHRSGVISPSNDGSGPHPNHGPRSPFVHPDGHFSAVQMVEERLKEAMKIMMDKDSWLVSISAFQASLTKFLEDPSSSMGVINASNLI